MVPFVSGLKLPVEVGWKKVVERLGPTAIGLVLRYLSTYMVNGDGLRSSLWVVVRAINTEWSTSGWTLGSSVLVYL